MTKNHQIWAKSEIDNTYCLVKVKFKKPYLFTRKIKKQTLNMCFFQNWSKLISGKYLSKFEQCVVDRELTILM